MEKTIDDLDQRILAELQHDARVPFRIIAEKHGVSIGTVHNRLRRLKNEGIVKGFVPVLDEQKLGFQFSVLTTVVVDGGHVEAVKATFASLPGVLVAWQTSGSSDLTIVARFKAREELTSFTASVARIQHAKAQTNLIMGTSPDACIITKN